MVYDNKKVIDGIGNTIIIPINHSISIIYLTNNFIKKQQFYYIVLLFDI